MLFEYEKIEGKRSVRQWEEQAQRRLEEGDHPENTEVSQFVQQAGGEGWTTEGHTAEAGSVAGSDWVKGCMWPSQSPSS